MRNQIWVVARREFYLKLRSKAIAISALIMVAIAAISPWISHFTHSQTQRAEIAVISDVPLFVKSIKDISEPQSGASILKLDFIKVSDRNLAESDLKKENYDALLVQQDQQFQIITHSQTSEAIVNALVSVLQQLSMKEFLRNSNISESQLRQYLASQMPQISNLYTKKNSIDYSVALFALLLLYMILSLSGGFLALTIIEEKSGRIMEVLLSSISPQQLFLGKIFGVLIFSISQFLIVVFTWICSSNLAGSPAIKGVTFLQFLFYLLWFVPGLLFFSFVYGGLGALISRSEDAGAIQGPMSLVLIGSMYGSVYSLSNPDSSFVKIATFIPPINFFVAPARLLISGEITQPIIIGYVIALLSTTIAIYAALTLFARNALKARRYSFRRVKHVFS